MKKNFVTGRSVCLLLTVLFAVSCMLGGCGDKEQPVATQPTEGTTAATEGEFVNVPEILPNSVDVLQETAPDTGEALGIRFPCDLSDYGLKLVKLEAYSGEFIEDGSNRNVEKAAMLQVENYGDFPLEYASISIDCGAETLTFEIMWLPIGEQLMALEKNGKTLPEEAPTAARTVILQGVPMGMSEDKLQVTDNGDHTLTVTNLTEETVPQGSILYKQYKTDAEMFFGGIAFRVDVPEIKGGESVTVTPDHYVSEGSRILAVTIDTDR